jgi:hypothetical protein
LFRSRLDQIINLKHALINPSRAIDWRFLDERFGSVCAEGSRQSDAADGRLGDPQAHAILGEFHHRYARI